MEDIEVHSFHQTQQRADKNFSDYAGRVGAIKIIAMKERSNDRASNKSRANFSRNHALVHASLS